MFLFYFLYLITLSLCLVVLSFFFWEWDRFFRKLSFFVPKLNKDGKEVLWLHGVSVGELRSLLAFAKIARQDYRLIITTETKSAMGMAKKLYKDDLVLYFPFDHPLVVMRFLNLIRPKAICFAEAEVWPFLLMIAYKKGIATFLISGHITDRDMRRYTFLKRIFTKVFNYHKLLLVQSMADYKKIVAMGIDNAKVHITGNLKFDLSMLLEGADKIFADKIFIEGFKDSTIIIAGSTHLGEEEIVIDVFSKLCDTFSNIVLIIAPRDIKRVGELARYIKKLCSYKPIIFSNLSNNNSTRAKEMNKDRNRNIIKDSSIILVDTIGELLSLYKLSDIVIMGGTFVGGFGGHNIIEPAYFSKPIILGPFIYNIDTIVKDFALHNAILLCKYGDETLGEDYRVSSKRKCKVALEEQLFLYTRDLIINKALREEIGLNARNRVSKSIGVSKKTFDMIKAVIA